MPDFPQGFVSEKSMAPNAFVFDYQYQPGRDVGLKAKALAQDLTPNGSAEGI